MLDFTNNEHLSLESLIRFYQKTSVLSENPQELIEYISTFIFQAFQLEGISFFDFFSPKTEEPTFIFEKHGPNVSEEYCKILNDGSIASAAIDENKLFCFKEDLYIYPVYGKRDLIGFFYVVGNKLNSAQEFSVDSMAKTQEMMLNFFSIVSLMIENSYLRQKEQRLLTEIINIQLEFLNARTKGAELHSRNVQKLAVDIGNELKLSKRELETLKIGGLLFDIGKIGIPDEILSKPGPLVAEEQRILKKHLENGQAMVGKFSSFNEDVKSVIVSHHELMNGSGYLKGLKGNEIPLPTRIITVCDVYCALTEKRPYRDAWTRTKALDYMLENAGILYDGKVVSVLTRLVSLTDE